MNQNNSKKELRLDGQKLAWHKDRVDAWLNGEKIAPITIDCALTRRCNYRCVYCYGQLQANDEKRITRDVIYRFLDDAAEMDVKAISFVGDGESTCSPHLYDAILRGKSNGLDMALGTAGYLLKNERLEEILPALTYLRFNISASDKKRYAEIHGCDENCFVKVINTVKECVKIKKEKKLEITIGLQMVLLQSLEDQIIPMAKLGKELGVDYLVIKHCSDDETGSLGVNYQKYYDLASTLREAESYSEGEYHVKVKWSKILSGATKEYSQCYGPAFIMQFSGSGLVAPCGMLFNQRYSKYHIGNIAETSFKEIINGKRYWEVLKLLASPGFDTKTMCGSLCLQHNVNDALWKVKHEKAVLEKRWDDSIMHMNFI